MSASRQHARRPMARSKPAQPRPASNAEISDAFYRLAELYELQQDEAFRIRAYRRAAGWIRRMQRALSGMVARDEDLSALPTIGETMAAQIVELCTTGRLQALDEAEARTPPGLRVLSSLPGIGPKRLKRLQDYLAVASLETLREAVEGGQVRRVPGLGPGIERNLRKALDTDAAGPTARSLR